MRLPPVRRREERSDVAIYSCVQTLIAKARSFGAAGADLGGAWPSHRSTRSSAHPGLFADRAGRVWWGAHG